ncbi:killer cell lectin-like receptor subfamily G member 1 isoform X2 [Polypterus senegalus]|uniref:killer cell lectin-like receptor subfamily G member 1 isoform X2 n=1 Tax=Polypterus senegalus TaxID=55291 RepID=UPI001962A261|nr:killer cell lectin-like receptor subfamily G member 1 isoform X2 [Polypterus senegalus]
MAEDTTYTVITLSRIGQDRTGENEEPDIMAQTTMSEEGTVPRVKKDRWLNIAIVSLAGGLLLAVGAAFSVLLTWSKGKCCPDMWVQYEKDCYYLSTNQTTWSLSEDDCISRGAGLVIATHPEELNFLLLQCRSFVAFWIGLRRNPGQEWMWTDNQPFTLGRVNKSVPDGDCAMLEKNWIHSHNCSRLKHWICKMAAD